MLGEMVEMAEMVGMVETVDKLEKAFATLFNPNHMPTCIYNGPT